MHDSLKVGIYTNQYPGLSGSGGIGTYTRSLAAALHKLGHQVHVLAGGPDNQSRQMDGVSVHSIKTGHLPIVEKRFPGARAAWQISSKARKLAKDYALDIFEFPNWEGGGRFFKGRFGPRIPMVVRLHTSFSEIVELEGIPLDRAARFACDLEAQTCRSADAIFVSTHAHRHRMAGELGVPESSVSVLPLGIPDRETGARGIPRGKSSPPVILYLGRLETRKGTIDLLHALPEIVRHIPDVRVVLIGKDRAHAPGNVTHAHYFASAFPPAIQKHVIFAGSLSDAEVAEWFARADLMAVPSLYESFGLISIEAMRAGLPVIGARSGGIPEVVEDGVNGILVEPRAPEQIAAAAVRLLSDEPLRMKLAAQARQTYEQKFSSLLMAERTADFYRGAIRKQQGSAKEVRPARESKLSARALPKS